MIMYCEDAPCCGCCTPRALGWYDDEPYDPDMFLAQDRDVDDELDPSECDHKGGNYSYYEDVRKTEVECDDCGTIGHRYFIMGEQREVFPETKIDYSYEGNEDAWLDGSYEA